MRVVFSIDHIYRHGGAEKVLVEKANFLVDILNYEVLIVTTEQQGKPSCYILSEKVELIDLGVDYIRSKSYFNLANLRKFPSHYIKQKKIFNVLNPDVVIVCNYSYDFYWLPFLIKRIPKLKEFHLSRFFIHENRLRNSSLIRKIKYNFNDWIESKYDKLILLNHDEESYYNSQNISVIPNPISIPKGRASLINKQVIAAGRIAPVKGFDRLIEIWAEVVAENPKWELHIYGEDYLGTQSILENQIEKLKMTENIFFKGSINNMTETMLNYSMYLMTSHTECFPMVLLESLSVGLPIIAFDVPTGPRNIITSEVDGYLIENNDILAFAQKINCLILDSAQLNKLSLNAKNNSYRFSNEFIMEDWDILLHSVVEK